MDLAWYEQTLTDMAQAEMPEQLRDSLSARFAALGLPLWSAGFAMATSLSLPETVILTNYPDEWFEAYIGQNC